MPTIILKRNKRRWRGSVTVNGVTKQKTFQDESPKCQKQAIAWEEGTRSQMIEGVIESAGAYVSLRIFADSHLDDVKTHCVEKTYQEKKCALNRFFYFTGLGPEKTVAEIAAFARPFLIQHAAQFGGSSANKIRKNLSRAWEYGVKEFSEKWPNARNPFLAVDKFPEDQKRRYVPPVEDFWKIVRMASTQDGLLLLTYYVTAARRCELFRLHWADVNFENRMLLLGTRKKLGGLRNDWMPIPEPLCKELKSWRIEQARILGHQQPFIFVCIDRTPLAEEQYGKPYTVRQHFMRTICGLAEVPPFGYHGIRHLVAHTFYKQGKSLGFIQRYLRHQHPTTTEKYLRALDCNDIRTGAEELMIPSLEQLKMDQDHLMEQALDHVVGETKATSEVISLEDVRNKRESL